MPLYEYVCRACQHGFELLVGHGEKTACPQCESGDIQKQLSRFAAGTSAHAGPAIGAAGMGCGTCGDPRGPGACGLEN